MRKLRKPTEVKRLREERGGDELPFGHLLLEERVKHVRRKLVELESSWGEGLAVRGRELLRELLTPSVVNLNDDILLKLIDIAALLGHVYRHIEGTRETAIEFLVMVETFSNSPIQKVAGSTLSYLHPSLEELRGPLVKWTTYEG